MISRLKYQYRSLAKHPVISSISIGGFALSGAIVILLVAFILTERSYDKDIPDVENIYRVLANGDISYIPEEVAVQITEQIPEVKEASNYFVGNVPVIFKNEGYPSKMICTDRSIFNILGAEVIAGSLKDFHTHANQVILTESFAKKIFQNDNPIGQVVNLSHKQDAIVAAVIKNPPNNRSLKGDVFCSTKLQITYSGRGWNGKRTIFYNLLVKLNDNATLSSVEKLIKPIANAPYGRYAEEDYNYTLSPYKNAYFTLVKSDGLKHANVKLINLLSWLTISIFLFSIFNYVNFTVARISADIKDVGMHQVLGASKFDLFKRSISEVLFQLILSLVLSVAVIYFVKPIFEEILGQKVVIGPFLVSIPYLTFMLISVVIIAVIAGSYPAYIALKAKPGKLLKSKVASMQKQSDIRMPLNIIQFAASIVAVVALVTIQRQIDYAKNKELGFDTEQLVRISVHHRIKDHVPALMDKIGGLAGVKNICPTHGTPWAIYSYSEDNEFGRFPEIRSNHSFLETFDVKLIEGRNFYDGEEDTKVLINPKGMQQAGWDSFEGKKLFGGEVVGVIEDFHFEDLHEEVGALIIRNEEGLSHLNVRLYPGDISGTMKLIEHEFKEIAGNFNFEYSFYDEWMDSMYKKEENQARAIQFISILAMLLAALGMFGLASFSIKRRIKEIGIRKVNGAKVSEILSLLNKEFIKGIAIAFLIATPFAWYIMNKWLENFAYRAELSWWIFVLAGVLALGIALITVSFQSWRAATRNPVEALRYE